MIPAKTRPAMSSDLACAVGGQGESFSTYKVTFPCRTTHGFRLVLLIVQ